MGRSGGRVSLQDIARQTGYSLTTVSRALRNKKDIGRETTERIKAAASALGYVPDQTAVSLRYGTTHVIALILVDFTNLFFIITTNLIQTAAQAAGYSLMVFCSRNSPELEMQQVEQAIGRRVDGVILFPTGTSGPSIERMRAAGLPFVLVSAALEPGRDDCVVINDEEGAYLGVRHLLAAGHRKAAFISACDDVLSYNDRRAGFNRACDEAGLKLSDRRCVLLPSLTTSPLEQERDEYVKGIAGKLAELKKDGFTGLFVFCDFEAWRLLNVLQDCEGLSVRDFGIVGFDDVEGAWNAPTALCSVDAGFREMAENSIRLLLRRIRGESFPPQRIVCPVRVVCRNSCR